RSGLVDGEDLVVDGGFGGHGDASWGEPCACRPRSGPEIDKKSGLPAHGVPGDGWFDWVGELPCGELAGGSVQPFGHCDIRGCWRDAREGFAVEGIAGGGEVEVVLVAAARDVVVGLGPGGGGVHSAGGYGASRALNGVAGERVG